VIENADPTDSTIFRRVLSRFPTGLVVLATQTSERRYGLTCQAFTSVSLEPPLVGAFLRRESGSLWAIEQTQKFTISMLGDDQTELARIFAIPGADKFRDVPLRESPGGLPIIDGSLAWLECTVHSRFEAGDHIGVLGLVTSMGCMEEHKPLIYWRGGYGVYE
jgi:flavin reductase (DIM6/NTAB) family NADH-FMN oxidoreductase RutF